MRLSSITARLSVIAVAAAVVVASPQVVAAQSDCRNLEAQLASVSNGGDRTKLRRYERAIISQKQQLERAKNRQQNNGCGSFLASIKPQCGDIRATVAKMERNLLQLQRTKNEIAGGSAKREKARILTAIKKNGCRDATARNEDDNRSKGLFSRLFGSRESERKNTIDVEEATTSRNSSSGRSAKPGNYRTLCVRTCDGYFFPIAYSSSPKLFDRDSKACQAMCPGTEVELFYHRVPDEETDAMISSVNGEPYTELPMAFRYRDPAYERTKACKCNAPKEFSIIAGDLPEQTEDDEAVEQATILPEPEARPDPAEDPETRANREGGLTASSIAELLAPQIAVVEEEPAMRTLDDDNERRIRVVGPAFLPDPEAAIDLRAPGRTELQ